MKICVVGLGLIGGSVCMALKRAGYTVFGANRSQKPLTYALNNGIIDGVAEEFDGFDLTFVCLPPEACAEFINSTEFKDGSIVSDICGVKKWIEDEVYSKPRNFKFVGTHPMAGKEVSGVENACADLFDNASLIITNTRKSDISAVQLIKKLAKEMGFGRVVECSAEVHDRKIAYTSQLAHIVSNAYVKDREIDCCLGFTGGSFQDMTRIAGVDETVWASLYLKNKRNVCEKLSSVINSLEEIKSAVELGDKAELEALLKNGRTIFEESKTVKENGDIKITVL
ncbi:MAG: prephenate dehydrogenase/arogenate dehydrogenase family protein [Clostridia bacterium]|nr:prephenate dehydrogenase/arogenate dehydrogenase family protein [Clostridia bacterium]